MPIFHKFKFYSKYVKSDGVVDQYNTLSPEDFLILNGICALSARFSSSPFFSGMPVKDRGLQYAARALSIAQTSIQESPTLSFLQGCILLAFFHMTSQPTSRSWLMAGQCCLLAYDLDLSTTDEDIIQAEDPFKAHQSLSAEEWGQREESRRAWWAVWELDTFASVMSCRPFKIDRNRMFVLLPVSDSNWLSSEPIPSAPVGPTPLSTWKSLQSSPNQDERAWFLVCNTLTAWAHELSQRRVVRVQERKDMESALVCFALVLPRQFHLNIRSLEFDEQNICRSNWIIATNLMLQR